KTTCEETGICFVFKHAGNHIVAQFKLTSFLAKLCKLVSLCIRVAVFTVKLTRVAGMQGKSRYAFLLVLFIVFSNAHIQDLQRFTQLVKPRLMLNHHRILSYRRVELFRFLWL